MKRNKDKLRDLRVSPGDLVTKIYGCVKEDEIDAVGIVLSVTRTQNAFASVQLPHGLRSWRVENLEVVGSSTC